MTTLNTVIKPYTQEAINDCVALYKTYNLDYYNTALDKAIDYLYQCSVRGTLPAFIDSHSVDFVFVTLKGDIYGVTDTQAGALYQIQKEFNGQYKIGQLFKVSDKNCVVHSL